MPIRSAHRANSSHHSNQHRPPAHFALNAKNSLDFVTENMNCNNATKCCGCDMAIFDRYIMTVLDRNWHADCLRCFHCKCPLQDKCFSRNDKLFCRDDFFRMFGIKCFGCNAGICPNELVQRSPRGDIYHLKCFICATCQKQLTTGDQLYVTSEGQFVCKDDYNNHRNNLHRVPPPMPSVKTECLSPGVLVTASAQSPVSESIKREELNEPEALPAKGHSKEFSSGSVGDNGEVPDDLEVEAEGEGELEDDDEEMKTSTHSDREKDSKSPAASSIDESEPRNDENNISTKRRGPRTTIKAKQLDLLKNAFAQTPKPTRHIREQLAQETGLTMRVIQVWFQNRRSKERRMKQLTAMGSARRNMFRPRRSGGVRSLREFDADSGDMMGSVNVGPGNGPASGFTFYPEGAGNHGHPHGHGHDFFPGHPHPHPHVQPGMFEFAPFPPRHGPGDTMTHFGELPPNGMPGGMNMEGNCFGMSEMSSSPPMAMSESGPYPGHFEPIHPGPTPVSNSDCASPVWQTMTMAQ